MSGSGQPNNIPGASAFAVLLLAAAMLALEACAHVPIIDESRLMQEAGGTGKITVFGARGPLSARQSRALLARVAREAPNAGALERHLAAEQIVAESPLFAGNRVRILRDGSETFPAIFDAIEGARHTLDLEYYIFEDVQSGGRRVGDLLVGRARAGVRVRVIYDAFGSLDSPSTFLDRLRAAGVQLLEYNPVNPLKASGHYSPNMRDHRKLLVADDAVAIVGGINLATEESGPSIGASEAAEPKSKKGQEPRQVWHDIDVEIRGPVVPEFSRVFGEHWRSLHGPPLEERQPPREETSGTLEGGREIVRVLGSTPERLTSRYYATVLTAIRTADSSIWLTAAYFVPTHQELRGLEAAARRGVDVRVLLPSHSDIGAIIPVERSYYPALLRAGVKIYERSDGIVHSKSMVVDDVWSLVGSSNFDQRSVLFNDEIDAVILGKSTADQLRADLESDMQHAEPIGWAQVRSEGAIERLKGWFWRLWEQLL
ncbi:MAG TPA: phospholipase D-like domain-containing protein [Steroidobacteraceae bacterium]|nr:phospholipase D-like domain-containing protein [Steroidobacteraceae bacterium]